MSLSSLTTYLPQSPCICALDSLGVVKVEGPDSKKFLQGQLTSDVNALKNGEHQTAAACTPQGRVKAFFHLVQQEESLLLILPHSMLEAFLLGIKKYAAFFKTSLTDMSSQVSVLGLVGKSHNIEEPNYPLHYSPNRALVIVDKDHSYVANQPESVWQCWDIVDGAPNIVPENTEKLLPHHINLPVLGTVNFKKGCYTGQEIVARMEFRGTLKTRLHRGLVRAENVAIGTEVIAGERAEGEVVSRAPIAPNQWAVLFTLNDSALSNSLHLSSESAPILQRVDPS